jgi:hypothetical protein
MTHLTRLNCVTLLWGAPGHVVLITPFHSCKQQSLEHPCLPATNSTWTPRPCCLTSQSCYMEVVLGCAILCHKAAADHI